MQNSSEKRPLHSSSPTLPALAEVLARAIQWTATDERGRYWTTLLHRTDLPLTFVATEAERREDHRTAQLLTETGLHVRAVQQELGSILLLWSRLDWMDNMLREGKLTEEAFCLFTATDIDQFHVRLRSAFDYLAQIARACAARPFEMPGGGSYNSLVKWLEANPSRHAKLGDVATLVTGTREWFFGLKEMREVMVHHGGFTLVFPGDRIGFMVLKPGMGFRPRPSTVPPLVMQNENVVDFERYAVAHTCWFVDLAESLMQLLVARWNIPRLDGVRSAGGAIEWFHGGTQQLHSVLGSAQAAQPGAGPVR